MSNSSTSRYMLKYQKAKAKLVEYDIDKADYPQFPLESNELSYPTIYIISRYVEGVIENDADIRNEFAPHLIMASQYFDAAIQSKDRERYDYDFLLSGATAYFLSDDYGSAKVLCSKITFSEDVVNESPRNALVKLLGFILMNNELPQIDGNSLLARAINSLGSYFRTGVLAENQYGLLHQYRKEIYGNDDPMDLYYVDIFVAIAMESIKKSAWSNLPDCSGVAKDKWRGYLARPKATKLLWPSQQLICEQGILNGASAIVQLPTGVGKTKSIELIIRSAFLAGRATTAIIIAPLRALCNEITNDMNLAFANESAISQFSDVLQEDFSFDLSDIFRTRIIVCTPEKLRYIMHHQEDILDDIDLFIFDEGHMFDDGDRGASYELLVSEIREIISTEKQIVLMSAVLSNAEQIKNWLLKNNGVLASNENIKATPKSIGFASQTKDINYFSDDANKSDYFIPKSIEIVQLKNSKRESIVRNFPVMTDAKDIALYYAIKLCQNGGVAIYVNRTDSVRTVIRRFLELHRREYDLTKLANLTNAVQAVKIQNLITSYYGVDHEYSQSARLGIFPHYSSLPNGIKLAVEYAIRHNHLRFVVCTSTLAQGVNIPIKYLFMTSFKVVRSSMQIRNFQNLIGRTARSGMYTEGSIVVADPKFYDQRYDRKHGGNYRWNDCIKMFDSNASEPCGSSILSVVQDFNIDHEVTIKGEKISRYIIDRYENPDCFSVLIEKLRLWCAKKYPTKGQSAITAVLELRQSIIESIENHLCFIFPRYADGDFEEGAMNICRETLAYTLASDTEKDLLIQLFAAIARKIESISDPILIQKYSRTMIGINLSRKIETWIEQQGIADALYTEEQLMDMITDFFLETHNVKISSEQFKELSRLWVLGKTFSEMSNESKLSVDSIADVCSKAISYRLSFFVGCIIDILGGDTNDKDVVDLCSMLCVLQKKIKYGVSTVNAISVCESIFNDRYLAGKISNILETQTAEVDVVASIKDCSEEIMSILEPFPEFFTERVNMLIN